MLSLRRMMPPAKSVWKTGPTTAMAPRTRPLGTPISHRPSGTEPLAFTAVCPATISIGKVYNVGRMPSPIRTPFGEPATAR
jgi:hypothetical protein